MSTHWHICVDTGGTFTDCIARDPTGTLRRAKVLSSGQLRSRIVERLDDRRVRIDLAWARTADLLRGYRASLLSSDANATIGSECTVIANDSSGVLELEHLPKSARSGDRLELRTGEPAPILAARLVTGTAADRPLPPMHLRLATTRGTNALLERAGASIALFITRGFGDLLIIGDQQRPDIFALNVRTRAPLHQTVVEVPQRMAADGSVIEELDEDAVREAAQRCLADGITTGAVALMHSYRNDVHERRIAELLRSIGFEHVSISSELAPLIELLPRAETAVVDAYLAPVVGRYLSAVYKAMSDQTSTVHVMTSAGGLVAAGAYRAKDSLLSGPAGGVAGAAAAGRACGITRVIGFDMGGTSTDVARFDGDFEYRFQHTVGGARLMAPALAIETVAAGGGSICEFVDDRLRVGPRSAGAEPGPACYGAGGPLTITDVNLLCGRIDPAQFEIPIDPGQARAALDAVVSAIGDEGSGAEPDRDDVLDGLIEIANERMAEAIRQISLRRGYDPAEYALVSFGGAGGQHACAVADKLDMSTIIMPLDASLLSAVGLADAVIERFSQRQVLARLDDVRGELSTWIDECGEQALAEVLAEGVHRSEAQIRRRIANVRVEGQDATLALDIEAVDDIPAAFARLYQRTYGHAPPQRPLEVESIRVAASSHRPAVEQRSKDEPTCIEARAKRQVRARFAGQWLDVPAFDRDELVPGACIDGPAIVFEQFSSFIIEIGWRTRLDPSGAMILTRSSKQEARSRGDDAQLEAARLELFTSRMMAIADEMGEVLQRTSLSTNVKRRLDFSCGVLDSQGRLVANGLHIPVHLGALGLCVQAVRDELEMRPGDVIVTNHPGFGGSHLPDVTVITPVFDDARALLGYVASRAHHAEIGGTRPGSMPPMARSLAEEGVVIRPMRVVDAGEPRFDALEQLLRSSEYPSRAAADNLADVQAAVAANTRGAEALRELARSWGRREVEQRMDDLRRRATKLARAAIASLPDGSCQAAEYLDDGSPLAVRLDIAGDQAHVDFSGTASQHAGNLNATPAIVHSALLYVLRLMIGERLPLNEGILDAVTITLPVCLLNPTFADKPAQCPAVVGGNTETSQRLVDTLLKALQLCACSQGTMNNVLFGTEAFGYYETVCGGCGAGPAHHGADAVHSHMTNTRITDPELIEHRYPVRVQRFAIRHGSGGAGKFHGGDGVIRALRFLQPMALSVLTQHRVQRPYGMRGGGEGLPGMQRVVRAAGEIIELASIDQCDMQAGDVFELHTPGGGGYGPETT